MFGQILGNLGGSEETSNCDGRKRLTLLTVIERMQRAFEAAEKCRIPVIAAVHGACIGGAIDLVCFLLSAAVLLAELLQIAACDIVFASKDAHFRSRRSTWNYSGHGHAAETASARCAFGCCARMGLYR